MKDKRGITLTELIVVVFLLSIVLALGYQTVAHFQLSYQKTEQSWIDQDAVMTAVDFIEGKIKSTSNASIYINFQETDMIYGYSYIYNKDGFIYYRPAEAGSTPEKVVDYPLSVRFDLGKKEDGTNLTKVLNYTVTAAAVDGSAGYSASNSILFKNMKLFESIFLESGGEGTFFEFK